MNDTAYTKIAASTPGARLPRLPSFSSHSCSSQRYEMKNRINWPRRTRKIPKSERCRMTIGARTATGISVRLFIQRTRKYVAMIAGTNCRIMPNTNSYYTMGRA